MLIVILPSILLCLTHKSYKSFSGLKNSGISGTLLDNGDGTTTDFDSATPITDDQKPINKSDWNVIASKTFKLVKNGDPTNWNSGTLPATNPTAPNLIGAGSKDFSVILNNLPTLKYDSSSSTLPTNYAPVFQAIFYTTDMTPVSGNGAMVDFQARSHMYYKDF